jgi:hypothetical protein
MSEDDRQSSMLPPWTSRSPALRSCVFDVVVVVDVVVFGVALTTVWLVNGEAVVVVGGFVV